MTIDHDVEVVCGDDKIQLNFLWHGTLTDSVEFMHDMKLFSCDFWLSDSVGVDCTLVGDYL